MDPDKNRKTSIYSLIDPITHRVRYIGRTVQVLHRRYIDHICQSRVYDCYVHRWIRKLSKDGLVPQIKLLHVVTFEKSEFVEREMIKHYRQFCKLTNLADGGYGSSGFRIPFSKERARSYNSHRKGVKKKEYVLLKDNYYNSRIRMIGPDNPGKKRSKAVIQYDLDCNIIKNWNSGGEAGRILGLCPVGIMRCCKGEYNFSQGYIWKYKQ